MRKLVAFLFLCVAISGGVCADLTIDGQGNALTLNSTSTLSVAADTTLTLRNIILKGLSGERLVMEGSSSKLVLRNATVVLDGNYSFTQGGITFEDHVTIMGEHTFAYNTDQTSTVTSGSTLKFDIGTTFSYDPRVATSNLLSFVDASSRLFLNGCTLHATTSGMRLQRGTLLIDHSNTFSAEGTTAGNGIVFGDGSSVAENLNVEFFPGAHFDTVSGFFDLQNV